MLSFVKNKLFFYTDLWNRFWFDPIDLISLSVIRLLLGGHLLFMYIIRYLDRGLYFYQDGFLTAELAKSLYSEFNKPLFFLFPDSDLGIQIFLWLHLIGLFVFMLGLGNRLIYFVLFLVHLGLIQRNHFIVYGADIFSNYWLLYLSLTQCDRYLSVKCWFRNYKKKITGKAPLNALKSVKDSDIFSSIGFRLIQIQLCVSYAYTGMEKLRGAQWWKGDALWSVITNRQFVSVDLSFLANWPWLIALMTFVTVLWEVYFPLLVCIKPTRILTLLIGFIFHSMTALFMGLYFFSGVMLINYAVFIEPQFLRKIFYKVFVFLRLEKAIS